jgi:hypothetical protein
MDATEKKDRERIAQHHGGPATDGAGQRPFWRRMHRSPFVWISALFILAAMVIFIMTDGFLLRPRPPAPAPRSTPP